MLSALLRLHLGAASVLYTADPNPLPMLPVYVLVATFLASVVKQFFDAAALKRKWERDRLDAIQKREWERSDRLEVARVLQVNTDAAKDHADTVTSAIAENTKLTREGIAVSETALNAANHTNEKLLALGVAMNEEDTRL